MIRTSFLKGWSYSIFSNFGPYDVSCRHVDVLVILLARASMHTGCKTSSSYEDRPQRGPRDICLKQDRKYQKCVIITSLYEKKQLENSVSTGSKNYLNDNFCLII